MTATFTIIVDSREQLPFDFTKFGVETVRAAMPSGDYEIVGMPEVAVERKSGSDLYGVMCVTTGRDRFQRELERLREFEFSAVVVENLEQDLLSGMYGRMSPKSIKATLIAWQTRYPTQWVFCPTRAWAERTTYLLLERFWRDIQSGKRSARETVPV